VDDERTDEPAEEEPAAREQAPATKKTPVTKVTPVVTEAEAEAAVADDEPPTVEEFDVSLGPLFTLGAVLVLVGVLRRRPTAVVAGLGAIWLDQRSEFGQRLKERVRARAGRRG
jgi:hypothetical protein